MKEGRLANVRRSDQGHIGGAAYLREVGLVIDDYKCGQISLEWLVQGVVFRRVR